MSSDDRLTPARRQYLGLKRRHPDALLLYRMGDFYELFDDDAVIASRDLNITLTSREFGKGNRVPMAGVPHHALASYLRRLLAKGHRVAIGEQLSEPGKGLVDRDVVRVLSPGTVVEPGLLAARENNYLVALNPGRHGTGLAYVDVSTGEFGVTEFAGSEEAALAAEMDRLAPAECLLPEGREAGADASGAAGGGGRHPLVRCPITVCSARWFQEGAGRDRLLRHFGVVSLEPFGCEQMPLGVGAAAAILAYVEGTNAGLLRLLRGLRAYRAGAHVELDAHTRRNLELTRAARSGERSGSLLAALDQTRTAMGGRLLRRWLSHPLRDIDAINRRLDGVEALAVEHDLRAAVLDALDRVGDLERLTGRARQGSASPRDLLALAAGLRAAERIAELMGNATLAPGPAPNSGRGETDRTTIEGVKPRPEALIPRSRSWERGVGGEGRVPLDIAELIERAVSDESGRTIRAGFDAELDELVCTVSTVQETLLEMERQERARTGIRSLKVAFNKVFGYYIEVSKANLRLVPAGYIRRQTLANAERFVTPELKEWEARILRAEERIERREREVFAELLDTVGARVDDLLVLAGALSELDVLAAFAEIAVRRRYVRPVLDSAPVIVIEEGRHPVVELTLDDGGFVPNDTVLGAWDGAGRATAMHSMGAAGRTPPSLGAPAPALPAVDAAGSDAGTSTEPVRPSPSHHAGAGDEPPAHLLLITGPNMAGKSTYLRQVALITLMAHAGCFVPAAGARIGVVDRIFSRVGAQDDLAGGASTFLVEMLETAAILRNASERSLLIFDEIGRGTSTFDGLAIAQAVVEDVHDRLGARTLFATHFHELTALAERLPGMRNCNVAAVEEGGRVVFLRRVVAGGADRSYGIHVARLAGLPDHVTARAEAILADLESGAQHIPTPDAGGHPVDAVAGPVPAASPALHQDSGARCPRCGREHWSVLAGDVGRLNLAATTPMEALNFLFHFQRRLSPGGWCRCDERPARGRLAVIPQARIAEEAGFYAAGDGRREHGSRQGAGQP